MEKTRKKVTRKKSKLTSEITPEIQSFIPEECWEHIISMVPINSAIVAYFVSKQWRRVYVRCLKRRISLELGLPLSKATYFPTKLMRLYSKIDVYILLEKLIGASGANNIDALLTLASRLQKISNSIVYSRCLVGSGVQVKLSELQDIYYKYVVVEDCTVENRQVAAVRDLATIFDNMNSSSFFWFGSDGRYIYTTDLRLNGMDPDRNFDWNFYDCNVYLRELGSDSESHIHLGNRGEWSLRSVWEGREYCQQEIIDWLGLNMKPYEFSNLFPLYFGYQKAPSNSAKLREVSMWENSREWLGGLSELENQLNLARNAFLNDEISWAEQIEFLTNGIKIKTTLLNRIKEVSFSTKQARKEFVSLLENANMQVQFFQNIKFQIPNGGNECEDVSERYTLLLYNKGKDRANIIVHRDDSYDEYRIRVEVPKDDTKRALQGLYSDHRDFDEQLKRLRKFLGLKALKVADLKVALAKLNPKAPFNPTAPKKK